MGYTTTFHGSFAIEPPLNAHEVAYLKKFHDTRRMSRGKGEYYVDNGGFAGQDHEADIADYNRPPDGQPSLWCQWLVSDDGASIEWDGQEKAYNMTEWLRYIIDHFLKPGAVTSADDVQAQHPQFAAFTYNHVVTGTVSAQGEDYGDLWMLDVTDNVVRVGYPSMTYTADDGTVISREVTL